MRFAERVNTLEDAKDMIETNGIEDYEILILWEENTGEFEGEDEEKSN